MCSRWLQRDLFQTGAWAHQFLKPGGRFFIWLYSYEGNDLYVHVFNGLRKVTTRLPHPLLRVLIEPIYGSLVMYGIAARVLPLPLRSCIHTVR